MFPGVGAYVDSWDFAWDEPREKLDIMTTEKRLIVLTGATRGLGRALVDRFVEEGHTVLGCGRDVGAISSLHQRYGAPHDFSALDVGSDEAVRAWAGRVLASHGAPSLLINNAAVINRLAPLWEMTAQEFDTLARINILGVVNVIRHFVPAMVKVSQGVIVNLSSGWGRGTSPEVAPYCASKWAIEGLTRAMAQELPQGMAAVPLNPGIIDTDMLRSAWGEDAGSYPSAETWSRTAAPFLLQLGSRDNGRALTVPG